MSFAEFKSFIKHLPAESAYQTAIRDLYTDAELAAMSSSGHGPWSKNEMLIAALIDSLNVLIHVQISKAGVEQEAPEPLPRPGVVSKRPSAAAQRDLYEQRRAKALAWAAANYHE